MTFSTRSLAGPERLIDTLTLYKSDPIPNKSLYSITSLVRASLIHGPSVVRGNFEWQNFSS